jgi:hypothetical protein
MSDFWIYLLIATLLIIVPLAIYAGRLLFQVKQQQIKVAKAEKAAIEALREHDTKIFDSVILISKAMLAEQCELSEGCWRITVLLDSLKTRGPFNTKIPAIYTLYDNIKHMAILADRKSLEKKQRMQQDFDRLRFEADALEAVTLELTQLLTLAEQEKQQLATNFLH